MCNSFQDTETWYVRKIILPVLPIIVALFISCGDSYSDMLEGGFSGTFLQVTYNSNNSTSGTPPVDMNTYSTGLYVTVSDNSGGLDRTGYTFNGWNTAPDGSGTGCSPLDSFTLGSNSVILYAWWIPIPYTVTFDSQGGSAVPPQTENYDSPVTEPAAPARTGYTFTGWFREASCTTQWIFATDTVSGDTYLYAGWDPVPYTVTFDSQGGSAVSSQTVIYGDLVAEPADPTMAGHTFGGWFTEPACATPWLFAIDTVTGDATLYAKWTINTYTLTYTAGAGGSISGAATQTVNHGSDGSPVTAVPDTGYHFVNWNDGLTDNPRTDFGVTGDITVSASFAINQYTLTYSAGSGGIISGATLQTVNHGSDGSPVTAVPDTGYHFVNWSDGSTDNPRTDTGVTGSITVSASFAVNQYTLTYTAGSGGTISGATPQTVNHGSNGSAVTAVPDTGYHFVNWSDGSTDNPRTDTGVTGSITVSASFAVTQYTVTYNGNGSTGGTVPSGSPYTYLYNDTVTVQDNTGSLVKTGYTFTGWNTQANACGTHYDPGTTFAMGAANITLYAHWTNLDMTFDPGTGVDAIVHAVAIQNDDKILIGGQFTSYSGITRNNIARLNTDASLDTSFLSDANNVVIAIAVQSDWQILIGGSFYYYNGTFRYTIARINTSDGSVDNTFDPVSGPSGGGAFTPYINDVAIQTDGNILVGGRFTSFNGAAQRHIARLNTGGGVDASFTGMDDERVTCIAVQDDGKILIGGDYFSTSYNGMSRNRIARLNADGSLDTGFDPGTGFDYAVNTIAVQSDDKILVGGSFNSYNGTTKNNIIRLNADGSIDLSFNSGTGANYGVADIAIQGDGKILIVGDFTTYNGTIRNRIARLNTDGTLDSTFDPGSGANSTVRAVSIQSDGKIVIGGSFTKYNGTTRNRIARINP